MIFDKTHKMALVYEKGEVNIISLESINTPKISEDELKYQELWVRYYNTIAIAARENPKCRMSLMPKRYWNDMVEMQGLLNKELNPCTSTNQEQLAAAF